MQGKWVWPATAVLCACIVGAGLYFGLRGCDSEDPQHRALRGGATQPGSSGGAGSTTVYATRTGQCYHRAGCRYLSKSKIPIALAEEARGQISRAQRSALSAQAQPYQDLIDQLLYAMAGLTDEETRGLEERLAAML